MFQCYKGQGIVRALKIGKKRESCRGEGGREREERERERERCRGEGERERREK